MQTIILVIAGLLALASASNDKKIICHFDSRTLRQSGEAKFDISYIDPTLCTHLIYTFVGLNEDGSVQVLDPSQDLPDNNGLNAFGQFNKLRTQNPELKTMIALGGWFEGSVKFSRIVNDLRLRKKFVENTYNFVKKYEFDGLEVFWEYPTQRGGIEADRENFSLLLKELREKFDDEGLILTAAVGGVDEGLSTCQSYNISEVSKYLHFINLLTDDLHGEWDKKTGITAPLYPGSWEKGAERELNIDSIVQYWLNNGAAAEKLVIGVPFINSGFILNDPKNNGIGAAADKPIPAGPYTGYLGVLGYSEICEMFQKENWTVHYQEEQRVPYAVNGDQWIGYDDERSLKEKADYVKRLGLGGIMIWSIEGDDYRGNCGEKYPLLKSIYSGLKSNVPSSKKEDQNHPDERDSDELNEVSEENNENYNNEENPPDVHDKSGESNETLENNGFDNGEINEDYNQNDYNDESNEINKILDNNDYDHEGDNGDYDDNDESNESNNAEQPPESNYKCKEEGYVRDPQDYEVFYYCQLLGNGYIKYPFRCPSGLVFDPCVKVCNWKYQSC